MSKTSWQEQPQSDQLRIKSGLNKYRSIISPTEKRMHPKEADGFVFLQLVFLTHGNLIEQFLDIKHKSTAFEQKVNAFYKQHVL